MDILIPILVILNIMLGTALFVVRVAQRDMEYANQARKEQDVKSYFRNDHFD